MQQALNILIIAIMVGVAGIVGFGLWNMFRGGDSNLSQKLMRFRIIAQLVAVLLLMAGLFFFSPR